jgi:hypothetical protein
MVKRSAPLHVVLSMPIWKIPGRIYWGSTTYPQPMGLCPETPQDIVALFHGLLFGG